MKKSTIKILLIELFVIIFLFLNNFVFNIFKVKELSVFIILLLAFISSILLLGYEKNRYDGQKYVTTTTFLITFLFQTFTFVLFGIISGFLKNSYTLGITHFFKIVFPITGIIIVSEILRHQLLKKGSSSKLVFVLTILFFVIIDIFTNISLYDLGTNKGIFELFALVIAPSIVRNILLSFVVFNKGFIPAIVYKLIMMLPAYYLPVYPDIGNYMTSIINILFPFILFVLFLEYMELEKNKKEEIENPVMFKLKNIISIIIIIFLLIIIGLSSGIFKYYLLAIGSGSMEPSISTGDSVLIEKIDKYDKLKIGDILVYRYDKKVIVHRITEINNEEGNYTFKTKGDNNKQEDIWVIDESKVIGIVKFKIPYVGVPVVKFNQLLGGI